MIYNFLGEKWRKMRSILSPSFTSSKMRIMFVLISKCTENFVNHFLKKDEKCIEVEMKDTFTRFTNDVIATSAFGVEVDSLEEPNNEFYSKGKKSTTFEGVSKLFMFIRYPVPKLIEYLQIPFMDPVVYRFFCDLVDNTIEVREKNNIIRPDMIHLLMEARKRGPHKKENSGVDTGFATVEKANFGAGHASELTNLDITAQAVLFFFAGFDTVSSLMCFMSHELAVHPDIQTKLRDEIEETLAECGGEVTYEAILKMKYMDMVISGEKLISFFPGAGHASELTNLDITAQAVLFFFAGFDTVSSLMCFMSHELAVHPDIQTKLRDEIEETLAECGGEVTYEAILKMKYMDMVISESLRKWPSTISTDRVCTKPYTIEAKNAGEKPLHIEKGTLLMIPSVGIHYDPKYYPDPERFDPERFSDENKRKIDPFTYMPFGLGPRLCIGSRFALLETKLLFFHLLSHFELVPVEKTQIPLKLSKFTFNLMAENGFWLGLKRLKK
nr:cytochrome P450 9e2-like [Leptinotarsa decemlineata]